MEKITFYFEEGYQDEFAALEERNVRVLFWEKNEENVSITWKKTYEEEDERESGWTCLPLSLKMLMRMSSLHVE